MANSQMQFGDLILTFTMSFDLMWNDKGSGAKQDGAFWQPKAPDGFYPLGSVGVGNYNDINNRNWALCVQAAASSSDAIAFPTDYTLIWDDKGSGADMDGSCWRPVPPSDDYVAMGDVFVQGYNKPSLNAVVCIRKDLTAPGSIGPEIYKDKDSGASMDLDTFQIITPSQIDINQVNGMFAANTFVANNKYGQPEGAPEINCLNLPFPVVTASEPPVPVLTSYSMPSSISGKTIDRMVYVPFTAITDTAHSLSWIIQNSPFYTVERQVAYQLELFNYNQTNKSQTVSKSVTTGISTSDSDTFRTTTGISVTAKEGIELLGSVSATVSEELGWETTTNITQFEEDTISRSLVTQPGTAAAEWCLSYNLVVVRADNSILPNQLGFNVNSFVESQYPRNAKSNGVSNSTKVEAAV